MSDAGEHIKIVLKNKKAYYEYQILEKIEAGIALRGTEVKSIRDGNVSLNDAFARSHGSQMVLMNMHVGTWDSANDYDQHEPTRPRQLLLHKNEARKLSHQLEAKGYTLLPLMLYFKRGKLKVELGLARGKNVHDKRQTSMKREADREMERAKKFRVN